MNATRLRWLLACAFCLLLLAALVAFNHQKPRLLVLHSYAESGRWEGQFNRGVQRALALEPHPHQHPPMAPHHGPYAHGSARTAPAPMPLAPRRALRALQDDALRAALHGPQGTRQEQAQALGISARTLYRRLRALQTPAAPDPFAVEKPLN